MRLSSRMKEMLLFIDTVNGGPNAKTSRPTHYGNLVTHWALLRRELIVEAADGTATLTEEGKKYVAKIRQTAAETQVGELPSTRRVTSRTRIVGVGRHLRLVQGPCDRAHTQSGS